MNVLVLVAACCGLTLVAAGAAGAHMVAVEAAAGWDAALLYGFVHTLAALAAALAPVRGRLSTASAWAFLAGVVLFSGIQIARTIAGESFSPFISALGALIPVGGLAFMAGWVLLGLAALMQRRNA